MDDETRDGPPASTGYRLSAKLAPAPRETRYERGDELARGGLGRITEARDRTLRRQVAIKELHQRTEQGRRQFEAESLTTARLQHPSIVSVFDVGTWESGEPYLVLQLLRGTTLAEAIAQRTTLDARLALLPNVLAVADALGYAHEQGVVHRDVKPSNVMLGAHGETVLLDWGVAYDPEVASEHAELVGTPRFMGPEQARNETPVAGFDVYSLGATLATVLSGTQPFAGTDSAIEQLRANRSGLPALPAEVPADLASIVAKATAPLAERYPHAGELAEDLRRFISGQLVGARRYTPRQLLARWLRRHRVLVAAAVAIVIAGVVAVTAILRARDAAVHEREQALLRAQELVLAQAKSRVRVDPTATIAWLKDYSLSAPHQDEVLALVDEASGRGVARHVWRAQTGEVDAAFADDGALVVATHDGAIVRIDAHTGERTQLAKLAMAPVFIRARGGAVYVFDENAVAWKIDRAGTVQLGSIESPARPTGMQLGANGAVKITNANAPAVWIGGPESRAYPRLVYTDDEFDATAVFGVTTSGALVLADPDPEPLAQLTPGSWVRASNDASHYLAVVPRGDTVAILAGSVTAPPVEIATSRACEVGEDLAQHADITNAGTVAAVWRCGVMTVYDVASRRPIPLPSSEAVSSFALSPDGRWLAIGHSDGFDLVDTTTGAARRLDAGTTSLQLGFARDSSQLFSIDVEQGVRVWPITATIAPAGRLGDLTTRLVMELVDDGHLVIRRHLDCATWSLAEQRVTSHATLAPNEARRGDDETMMWPWDVSDDGRTCIFAAREAGATVVTADGAHHFLVGPLDDCVLSGDGAVAWCNRGDTLVSIDVATTRELTSRPSGGSVRSLARYHGSPLALVRRARSCVLEKFDGALVADLGADECASAFELPGIHRNGEAGIGIARTHSFTVWTDAGMIDLPSELGRFAVSPERGVVAMVGQQRIELYDLRTHARLPGPPVHARAVDRAAWSSRGILASSDDETVQLWDPDSGRTRLIVAPHVAALAWSEDGRTLYTSDGKLVQSWPIELARGASWVEVRARLAHLTTARIVDGKVVTP